MQSISIENITTTTSDAAREFAFFFTGFLDVGKWCKPVQCVEVMRSDKDKQLAYMRVSGMSKREVADALHEAFAKGLLQLLPLPCDLREYAELDTENAPPDGSAREKIFINVMTFTADRPFKSSQIHAILQAHIVSRRLTSGLAVELQNSQKLLVQSQTKALEAKENVITMQSKRVRDLEAMLEMRSQLLSAVKANHEYREKLCFLTAEVKRLRTKYESQQQ